MGNSRYKFRAWDKENKKMVEVELLGKEVLLYKDGDWEWESIENFEVMQYTGLKDKNGKEIYAGDIVRGKYGKNGIVKNYEIRWIIGHFAAVDRNNMTGDERYYPIGLLEGEVIGNIFQNPEILEVEGK